MEESLHAMEQNKQVDKVVVKHLSICIYKSSYFKLMMMGINWMNLTFWSQVQDFSIVGK